MSPLPPRGDIHLTGHDRQKTTLSSRSQHRQKQWLYISILAFISHDIAVNREEIDNQIRQKKGTPPTKYSWYISRSQEPLWLKKDYNR